MRPFTMPAPGNLATTSGSILVAVDEPRYVMRASPAGDGRTAPYGRTRTPIDRAA